MDIIQAIYIVASLTMGFCFLMFVLIIAGKDIGMAFNIFFNRRGSHVFIANTNRNISHYYRTPKEDKFKFNKVHYITNPDKAMNLSRKDREKVYFYMMKKRERLTKKINELREKEKTATDQYNKIDEKDLNRNLVFQQIKYYQDTRKVFEEQLKIKQENYFFGKRPAFFYIEGDPIPKNFHEFYSALDCKIVDNLVSRGISAAPTQKQETEIRNLKLYLLVACIGAALAAYFAFRNNAAILEICQSLGLPCKIS